MNSDGRAAAGFTLLEMLVVLLIAGMALALTSQSLGQYQRAHARVSEHTRGGREYRLAEAWFRSSVRGLSAAEDVSVPGAVRDPSAPPVFRGDADGFEGLTLAPVLTGQGIPTAQQWRVVRGNRGDALELTEADRTLSLPVPGAGRLRLHYLDVEGELHPQWPPTDGEWPQLPAAVMLEIEPEAGRGALFAAAIAGPPDYVEVRYEPEPF